MTATKLVLPIASCMFSLTICLAQTAQAPAAPATPTWSIGPIDFSGLVDGYYGLNFNHPASRMNQLYNFDVKANQFSLNMAKVSMEHTPDPIGFSRRLSVPALNLPPRTETTAG